MIRPVLKRILRVLVQNMALHVKSLNQCERNFQLFSLNSSKKYQHMLQIYHRTSTSQVRILTARERQYVLTFSTVLEL